MAGLVYIAITTVLMLGAVFDRVALSLVLVVGLVIATATWVLLGARR